MVQSSPRVLTRCGTSANVVKMFPLFGGGEPLYLWAERGRVHWEFAKTNGYDSLAWEDAAERVLALSEMIARSSEEGSYADERLALQRFVIDMENVIRQAKEQGSINDPSMLRAIKRSRAKSVVVPREIDAIDPSF